jgi:hypothetical protein
MEDSDVIGRSFACSPAACLSSALVVLGLVVLGLVVATQGTGGAGATGVIEGEVTARPTRPVERADSPSPVLYVAHRRVTIETASGATVATTTTNERGHFSVTVPPGSYVVRVAIVPGTVGIRQNSPGDVMVIANQTNTVDIELDTGLR